MSKGFLTYHEEDRNEPHLKPSEIEYFLDLIN